MQVEIAEIAAGLPFACSFAAAGSAGALWIGRRRAALNEALHELRRPLQALALALPTDPEQSPSAASSLRLAVAALEQLDREINGGGGNAAVEEVRVRGLATAAVRRWKGRAALAGGSLALRWEAGDPWIAGHRSELEQALDNLIINAIEHGGPEVDLVVRESAGEVHLVVRDPGPASRSARRRESPAELVARLSGRRRRGHGLRVVRRIASDHGGAFHLRRAVARTEATLCLPGGHGRRAN